MKFKYLAFSLVSFSVFFGSNATSSEMLELFDAYIEGKEAVFKCSPSKESIDKKSPWMHICVSKIEEFIFQSENNNCKFVEKTKNNGLKALKDLANINSKNLSFTNFNYKLPIKQCG